MARIFPTKNSEIMSLLAMPPTLVELVLIVLMLFFYAKNGAFRYIICFLVIYFLFFHFWIYLVLFNVLFFKSNGLPFLLVYINLVGIIIKKTNHGPRACVTC